MQINHTAINDAVVDLKPLDELMGRNAFIRAAQWDYERVTYDYKINGKEKNVVFYIRIQAEALQGDVDKKNAIMKLKTPLLGKYYYPHGIEYGEEENFPDALIERAHDLVTRVFDEVKKYQTN